MLINLVLALVKEYITGSSICHQDNEQSEFNERSELMNVVNERREVTPRPICSVQICVPSMAPIHSYQSREERYLHPVRIESVLVQ